MKDKALVISTILNLKINSVMNEGNFKQNTFGLCFYDYLSLKWWKNPKLSQNYL
ncbi:hypothetical protein Anas_12135 [Armadillidium nasatum]|uniref:Uncharacterized protein n=1 Tax=Armadillidium nasatum TaxID=96803 RepID=A0A5N5TEX9_9CRUS|nr:hypothetical protein Anas_12135 [Armadillidium nasatum]